MIKITPAMHMVTIRANMAARDWLYQHKKNSGMNMSSRNNLLRGVASGSNPIATAAESAAVKP